jgi:hypothetical protein
MLKLNNYRLREDNYNLTLEEFHQGGNKLRTKEGVSKDRWVVIGYYPPTLNGRIQVFNRLVNLGISELEVQSFENVIETMERIESGIYDWLEKQDV